MGRILGLLHAAAGEESIHSAIGRWRQAVSEALDEVIDGVAGGGISIIQFVTNVQQFITQQTTINQTVSADLTQLNAAVADLSALNQLVQVTRGPVSQIGLTTGSDLILDRVLYSNSTDINYDTTTGIFTLAGSPEARTYLLTANGYLVNFSVATEFAIGWVDTGNVELPNDIPAVIRPVSSPSSASFNPIATAIITPGLAGVSVKLQVTNLVGGATADVPIRGFVATVILIH